MDLLQNASVPIEVIQDYILAQLRWNDFLRLRRVSKQNKYILNDYIQRRYDIAPEIGIRSYNNSKYNFGALLGMEIPLNRLFLNNANKADFSQNYDDFGEAFIKEHGQTIIHLRINKFSLHAQGKELEFMEGLSNLKSLTVDSYISKTKWETMPALFQQLQSLTIKNVFKEPLWQSSFGFIQSFEACLSTCQHLGELALPLVSRKHSNADSLIIRILNAVNSSIKFKAINGATNLKALDFQYMAQSNSPLDSLSAKALSELCMTCATNNVKLLNFRTNWLNYRPMIKLNLSKILISLKCFQYPYPRWTLNLPNLESLEIETVYGIDTTTNLNLQPSWPKLKRLDIGFDKWCEAKELVSSFKFLFETLSYAYLTELRVANLTKFDFEMANEVVHILATSCPNVKQLTLVNCLNWVPYSSDYSRLNEAWIGLWQGLPFLEEISLIDCALEDKRFIGQELGYGQPSFHKLTRLRKLYLADVSSTDKQYSNLTDLLFTKVLRFMKLTHCTLSFANNPKSEELFTYSGMESLLQGPFAQSIESFPINGWFANAVVPEKFQELHKRFRVHNLL